MKSGLIICDRLVTADLYDLITEPNDPGFGKIDAKYPFPEFESVAYCSEIFAGDA